MNKRFKSLAPRIGAMALAATLCASLRVGIPVNADTRFTDVPEGHWAAASIEYAVDKGYFSGTSADTFAPDNTMTRAMLWTVLARMDGSTATSAPGQPWYKSGQDWAMKNGISDGTNPDADITREQFATMLYNFAAYTGEDTDKSSSALSKFSDRNSIATYAVDALSWAVTKGIVSGTTSTTISPTVVTTRAQAATMLMRFDQMDENGETVNPGESDKPAQTVDYTTSIRVIDAPPLYPGDPIKVGGIAYVAIQTNPFGENVKDGVTYTLTCADPSMVTVREVNGISPGEVCFIVKGLKAGKATLTAVGSDGFRGSVTVTITGSENENTGTTTPGTTTPGTTTPSTGTANVDWGEFAEVKKAMLQATNEERVRNGLPTLEVTNDLMDYAQVRAEEWTVLADHVRPNGDSVGYAEIARYATWLDGNDAVNAWISSPGHHKIMLESKYKYIGIGVTQGADGWYYFIELFAR